MTAIEFNQKQLITLMAALHRYVGEYQFAQNAGDHTSFEQEIGRARALLNMFVIEEQQYHHTREAHK